MASGTSSSAAATTVRRTGLGVGLNGNSSLVDGQQLVEVSLYYAKHGVHGRVSKAVGDQAEISQSWVRVVGVRGADVVGTTHCIDHGLQLREDDPAQRILLSSVNSDANSNE